MSHSDKFREGIDRSLFETLSAVDLVSSDELLIDLVLSGIDPTEDPFEDDEDDEDGINGELRLALGDISTMVDRDVYEALIQQCKIYGIRKGVAAVLRGGLWLLQAPEVKGPPNPG